MEATGDSYMTTMSNLLVAGLNPDFFTATTEPFVEASQMRKVDSALSDHTGCGAVSGCGLDLRGVHDGDR